MEKDPIMYESRILLQGDVDVEIHAITDKRPEDDGWPFYVMRGARFFLRSGGKLKQVRGDTALKLLGWDHLSYSKDDVISCKKYPVG